MSTFTRGLNVLDAPLAAGVLNPPAIVSRNVALPPPVAFPPAAAISAPFGVSPSVYPSQLAAPTLLAPQAAFPGPFLPHAHYHAAPAALAGPIGAFPGPPAHVLPVPNARSIHALGPAPLAPAPVVEAGIW